MRASLVLPLVALFAAGPARAGADVDALLDALSIGEVAAIMRQEGIAYGADLEADMFPGSGRASWSAAVADIYSEDRFLPEFRAEFERSLKESSGDVAEMTRFFTSDTGKRAVSLELSARRALLDDEVGDASKLRVEEMRAEDDPRFHAVSDFIEANGLVEANVAGGLNSSLAFYRGLAEGGAMEEMSEAELLENVWSQEADIRAETTEWLYSFLIMAYAPLTDEELSAYTNFSRSEAGRDLNAALFAGFDAVFADVSHRLGQAAAVHIVGQDL